MLRCARQLFRDQSLLCTAPIITLVTVASLDAADKNLLASSFPVLARTLHLDISILGYFSLFSNLSYALALPLWGYLIHRYGIDNIHLLLATSCLSWGITTLGVVLFDESIFLQAVFRALNGVALASVMPLTQTLLVEIVPSSMRGRAFGFMGVCEKLAGMFAATFVVYMDNWQIPYYIMAFLSVMFAFIVKSELDPNKSKSDFRGVYQQVNICDSVKGHRDSKLSILQIIQRIARIPAFVCLVAQGVFGGTPWDIMSFMLLLLNWRNFHTEQIVAIQIAMGIGGTIGGWLGGTLGDWAAVRHGNRGRIYVAFTSVVGGIPLYAKFLYATEYEYALLYMFAFSVIGSWPGAAALRPICAYLAQNASERAQIVSMWMMLEKASGAIFGAPLVGYLASNLIDGLREAGDGSESIYADEKAGALAFYLCVLSSFFWALCSMFWLLMDYYMPLGDDVKLSVNAG
ncbi:hypothetical protein SARC_05187 [Sphaeroforma arctica JP610]|uniref:Major facilitator superfamily (MFS) profile domain-containing protein n=1 Tax=Sphaeroforma arctica JP610 TaxID=667725 RepID=A0A0L0G132_9EUKA|nr:hypothetical protein SARC_05187 [Sphaeroforma arctica JP610]KNC82539.1 hypothetical protein SARC_05187 [Sphaeroforma arctica JP610]|eukprot:XP_014156441.1 hypothetical protein SARC_05187 [Sphaeroforma arctica JP610]